MKIHFCSGENSFRWCWVAGKHFLFHNFELRTEKRRRFLLQQLKKKQGLEAGVIRIRLTICLLLCTRRVQWVFPGIVAHKLHNVVTSSASKPLGKKERNANAQFKAVSDFKHQQTALVFFPPFMFSPVGKMEPKCCLSFVFPHRTLNHHRRKQ